MHPPSENVRNATSLAVRRMSASDVSAAFSILEESPEASIWSRESLLESVSHGITWAAELDGRIVGILIGRVAADEFEILNLAVRRASRRRGFATKLVCAALEYAGSAGARQTYLEVRASNEGGTSFYTKLGFRIHGRRPKYYRNPTDDAVLLVLHNSKQNS